MFKKCDMALLQLRSFAVGLWKEQVRLALFEAFCIVLLTSNIIFYHMKRHFSLLTSLTTGRHTTYTSHI
ncbi:hypothetical protein BofuT4_uP129170.1 [Botrytis cinerea T4]|uniref:Uncharacterized protein n=1 Tax=Botryotinia fuckeliana (strain T4) TaxID=999810 RepID=G2YRG9_BOTF4|nr:hypothetical protein BofuT4_uP129170.1 [Botrytis cinerea T4]